MWFLFPGENEREKSRNGTLFDKSNYAILTKPGVDNLDDNEQHYDDCRLNKEKQTIKVMTKKDILLMLKTRLLVKAFLFDNVTHFA